MSGIDSYTKLLLHCNGADTSTTFTDSAFGAKTITANGDAQIDTAQSVFGGASGLFDGTGDFLSAADHADWDLGAGDFTIDFRLRIDTDGNYGLIGTADDVGANAGWAITTEGANFYFIYWVGGSISFPSFSWTPTADTWYHVAIVRTTNDLKLYINGTQTGATVDITGVTIQNSATTLKVGMYRPGSTLYLVGWLDEIRISKGIARWTSNFISPNKEYDTMQDSVVAGYSEV